MNAGSSRDTGTNESIRGFVIPITEPPVVQIDTAAYVKLREGKAVRTVPFTSASGFVMLDFDESDQVLGIEVVGLLEFGIRELLKAFPIGAAIEASEDALNRARYVAATA